MANPQPPPDSRGAPERLLERYLAGEASAFEDLVGLYEEKLFAFIVRMTGDNHLAEDVFQQTFIKVAKNAAAFDGRASFSTWLYRIARNATLDELRKRRNAPRLPDSESAGMEGVADRTAVAPLDKLVRDEQVERVRSALTLLPDAQREAFLLKEEGDLDFGAIGAILGCGRETAKSRFRLAVGKLRELLETEEDGA